MNRTLAGVVAFLTSAAVLVMEIVASRLLAPYVGVTLQTYTAIIGVVLTGISCGTWLGGRLADRRDPAGTIPTVLIAGGALVFASLFALRTAAKVFDRGGPFSAVALVVAAFLLPATVLSMVSPLLVKTSLGDLARTGREVGRISALGTAGAIVGTFVAGFVLVATIASPVILLVVGATVVALGVVCWVVSRDHSRRMSRAPLVALLVAGGGAGTVPFHKTPCTTETAYFCAIVRTDPDNASIRTLQLDTLEHSSVNLASDEQLLYEYTRAIGQAVDVSWPAHQPIRAMHIGGGGVSIPRYVRATRPRSINTVIERDKALIALDKRSLGLREGNGLTVRAQDGRIAMRAVKPKTLDLVVGDAFGGEAVPWHLATKEFIASINAALTNDGVYLLNAIDSPPSKFVKAEIATVAKVFPYIAVAAPPYAFQMQFGSNFIVMASRSPLQLDAIRRRYAETALNYEVLDGPALTNWVGKRKILTDAFAPVDQLLTVTS